ncbi:MAG: hypothetical protein Q8R37_04000 [Nanoarchaeota archaeon]|nr:hypothetical protein [Nanoarchaeota archaeon]
MGEYKRVEIQDLQKIDFNNTLIEVLGYVPKARFYSSKFADGYILSPQSGRVDFYSLNEETIARIKDAYQNLRCVIFQGRGIGQKLQIEEVISQDENKPSLNKKNGISPIED